MAPSKYMLNRASFEHGFLSSTRLCSGELILAMRRGQQPRMTTGEFSSDQSPFTCAPSGGPCVLVGIVFC